MSQYNLKEKVRDYQREYKRKNKAMINKRAMEMYYLTKYATKPIEVNDPLCTYRERYNFGFKIHIV